MPIAGCAARAGYVRLDLDVAIVPERAIGCRDGRGAAANRPAVEPGASSTAVPDRRAPVYMPPPKPPSS